MENNTAIVIRLQHIQPIPGADRIVQAEVYLDNVKLTQVVVGVGAAEGQTMVYFDSNLALSEELIKDLPDLATYLGHGRRVKAVKLKGIISNGLCVEVEKFFKYDSKKELAPGFSFNNLGDFPICKKYIPGPQRGSGEPNNKDKAPSRLIPDQFRFHRDTENLLRNINRISPFDVISITRKVHGTSAITSRVLVKFPERTLTWKDRLAQFFGVALWEMPDSYDYLYSSRNSIKNATYEIHDHLGLWEQVGETHFKDKLKKGESIYYEIIGYNLGGSLIQKGYDYGAVPGETKIQVYRITKTGVDGHVVEYGWAALKDRCKELGVEHVEEFYFGRAGDMFRNLDLDEDCEDPLLDWRLCFLNELKGAFLEKDTWDNILNKKLPDEGIVLRREGLEIESYKLKSERFVLRESEGRDKGEVDTEEQEVAENS